MYLSEMGEIWRRARPEAAVVHLDSAAASRSSTAVIEAVTAHLLRESERGGYVAQADAAERIGDARRDIAGLIGHDADDVAFVESANAALSALLANSGVEAPATVWVSPNEYGPNLTLFDRFGWGVRAMPAADEHGHVDTDALRDLLRSERPDLIHICHIGAHSGIVQPAAGIVEVAHEAGVPVVIDAAQALGHIDSVTGADAVYGTSRKWLAGPRGVGFLAARPGLMRRNQIESIEAFVAGRVGLGVAVREVSGFGVERVHRELAAIGRQTRESLLDIGAWRVIEPVWEPSAITTLAPPPGWESAEVTRARETLLSAGILVTCAESWRAPLGSTRTVLRLSPHLDVRREDLTRLADQLRQMDA